MSTRIRGFVCLLGCGLSTVVTGIARAQTPEPKPTGVSVHLSPLGSTPALVPAMISFVRSGTLIAQSELLVKGGEAGYFTRFPPGTYDIRVEGEGLVTEVKRGIQLIEDRGPALEFLIRAGKGVHIIEYAQGGLAREEVASRLAALDANVAKLQHDVTAIAVSPKDQTSDARTTGTVKWFNLPTVNITAINTKTGLVTAIDSSTKKLLQFKAPTAVVSKLTIGQKVWANFDTKQVSLNAADPCCIMVSPVANP